MKRHDTQAEAIAFCESVCQRAAAEGWTLTRTPVMVWHHSGDGITMIAPPAPNAQAQLYQACIQLHDLELT